MSSTVTGARLRPTSLETETAQESDFQTDVVNIPVKLCNLAPFNGIASQVLALTGDPDIPLRRISRVIEGDPALAADILFLANSSLFGFPSRMHVLRHAIALLGLDSIKALAVTVAIRSFLGRQTPLVRQCWQHSVACALVCEEISAIFDLPGDRAYTDGIMHDIGRLGLLKTYPKEMTTVLKSQYTDMQDALWAERDALNVDHARAGSWLVDYWALPKEFSEICEHHHDAPKANDSETLQLVKVACNIADAIGFPAVNCQRQPSYLEATSPLTLRPGHNEVPSEEHLRASVTARMGALCGAETTSVCND
jgi:HD-like signal output (HDOD) protein